MRACIRESGGHGGKVGLRQDKPSILASALLRLVESGNSANSTTQMEMAVLRSLDSTPEVRAEMPLWGSAAAKRVWQAGHTHPNLRVCERQRGSEAPKALLAAPAGPLECRPPQDAAGPAPLFCLEPSALAGRCPDQGGSRLLLALAQERSEAPEAMPAVLAASEEVPRVPEGRWQACHRSRGPEPPQAMGTPLDRGCQLREPGL